MRKKLSGISERPGLEAGRAKWKLPLRFLGPAEKAQQRALPSRLSQSGVRPCVSKSHLCMCVLALPQCQGQASVPCSQPVPHLFFYSSIHLLCVKYCARGSGYQSEQYGDGFCSQSICSKTAQTTEQCVSISGSGVKPRIYRGFEPVYRPKEAILGEVMLK